MSPFLIWLVGFFLGLTVVGIINGLDRFRSDADLHAALFAALVWPLTFPFFAVIIFVGSVTKLTAKLRPRKRG